ncbi:MAG: hypothetical protein PHY79_24890, partial [Anaerolineae bacterium]|nr:hypothetical protein [Anaerolineae bacterium]
PDDIRMDCVQDTLAAPTRKQADLVASCAEMHETNLKGLRWRRMICFGVQRKENGNQQQFGTVVGFLLIASALISACGTSSEKDVALASSTTTPALELLAAALPTDSPSPSPDIDFPLELNNTWVFQLTRYEGVPIDEIVTTTLIVTKTVVEVNNTSSYLMAKIHQEESAEIPVGEVPPSWQGVPLRPATSSEYWLVVSGNRMYRQERNLDLPSLSTALLEFVFPVKLGNKWYRSEEKAELNPTYADDWMLREVTKVGTVVVPAGEFNSCSFLEETWAGTTFETWFCPGVGVVDWKGDHHGTPGGFRQILIRYQLHK